MADTWNTLLASHARVQDPNRTSVPVHRPQAAIITCSDARVPPSVIFDQPAGSLFVVREAGNTASPGTIASIDYAVAELGVDVVIVLGHTNCGAIAAACAGRCDGYLSPLTAQICALVGDQERHATCPETLTDRNVVATVHALTESDTPTGHAIRAGDVVVGAVYDLATDAVRPLPIFTTPPTPKPQNKPQNKEEQTS